MNDDVRLANYFTERAQSIELAPNDARTITERGTRRQRRHRVTRIAAASAVLFAGAIAIVTQSSSDQSIKAAAPTGVERAALQWTAVDVADGLGWSTSGVTASDGSLFSLSTAPGPMPTDGNAPAVLYRSSDGTSWEAAALPSDLKATSLATSDGTLYAVGTAPGGGGIDLVVASSSDGAATWTEARIPMPAADLKAQYPNDVQISPPVVTSGPNGLVAAVTVAAFPDVSRLLPNETFPAGWHFTDTGVDIYAAPTDSCAEAMRSDASGPPSCEVKASEVAKSYTWDELGLEPALRALIPGEVHVYSSSDGSTFDEVETMGMPAGHVATLLGSSDGYRLLVGSGESATIHSLISTDGRTWTKDHDDLLGWPRSSGTLGDRPAVVVESYRDDEKGATTTLLVATQGGGWTSLPITTDTAASVMDVAVGRLGVVAIVTNGQTLSVLESTDGVSYRTQPLNDLVGAGEFSPAGITMNADAVTIRMLPAADPNGASQPGPQSLLVGTPG